MVETVWLLILIPLSLYCLSTYIKPVEGPRNRRSLVIAILGLAYAALHLHAAYFVLFGSLPHPGILFHITRGVVGGMLATILASMGFRHGARMMLLLAGLLFLGLPFLMVFNPRWLRPEAAPHLYFTSPNFLSAESYPLGIAVSAIVLLLRPGWIGNQRTGDRNGLTTERSIAQSGPEA